MLNLITSNLYRVSRPRGLRGSLWQYTLVPFFIYALYVATFLLVQSPLFAPADGSADAVYAVGATFISPTQCVASMAGGIAPLCVTFMMTELVIGDFKQGFIKSQLSARQGRLSYIAGTILFAGVLSALIILIACVLCAGVCLVLGATFEQGDTVLGVITWFAGFWLNTWALGALSLVLAYATRISPVSYIAAFCLCGAVVPQTLLGLAALASSLLGFLKPLIPVLETLAAWMPTSALENLNASGQLILNTGIDAFTATHAFTVDPALQAILTGIIWIATASALILVINRHKDI